MRFLFLNFKIADLLTNRSVDTGGACNLQYNLAQGLIKTGHQVGFLVHKDSIKNVSNTHGFDLVESYSDKRFRYKTAWFIYRIPALLKAAYKYNPDVIIQSGAGTITGVMCLVAHMVKKPFVFFAVSDWEADGGFISQSHFYEKVSFHYGLKHSKYIIAQNNYQKKCFKEKEGKESTILRTAYNMSYPDFNTSDQAKRPYVLWSGNFRPAKGMDRLLQIAKAAPEISFKVTGKQSYKDSEFDTLLSNLFSLPNVEQLGYLTNNELYLTFHNASVLLNTSRREGFPTTFIDAWYYGIPVITLNYDPDQLISKNNLGYVCRTEKEAARVLHEKIEGAGEIDRSRIASYVREKHSPTSLAQKFVKTLQ